MTVSSHRTGKIGTPIPVRPNCQLPIADNFIKKTVHLKLQLINGKILWGAPRHNFLFLAIFPGGHGRYFREMRLYGTHATESIFIVYYQIADYLHLIIF